MVPAKALKDPPQKNKLSARKVLEMARAQELARHKLKNIASKVMSRPKLPLFGKAASLQPRDDPTVPAKLFGFAKRIDSGLQAVSAFKENTGAKPSATSATAGISDTVHMPHLPHTHAHWEDGVIGGGIGGGGLFEGSASTVFTLESGGGTQPPGQLGEMSDTLSEGPGSVHSPVRGVYTAGLGREGDGKDLFGQKASPSLRDRISKTFLRKNSRRRKNTKMGRLIEQFVSFPFYLYHLYHRWHKAANIDNLFCLF